MKTYVLIMAAFAWAPAAFGHGEGKLGPNGGFVRMPGAFHSELKQEGPAKVSVYLLDFKFKNPLTDKSTVRASVVRVGSELPMDCAPSKSRFTCSLPKGTAFEEGDQLKIVASRNGSPGAPVTYDYPFKLGNGSGVPAHGAHH